MRRIWLGLLLLGAARLGPAAAAQTPRYADVRLRLAPGETLGERLAGTGVVLDHVARERTPGARSYRTVLREDELAAVQAAGIATDVLVADLAADYAGRAARGSACPATPFPITGSMGCYPTFSEAVALLDQMRAAYPALVSERLSIGTTHEGRALWMIEIGDHPGLDEGEPEVLLTALHHAREPQGLASLLHALWTALDGYATDPEWTYLLDHRRVFVVAVVNPDGYVYNQTTAPSGGGFWRKNRRPNGGGFGVDLNRNYGWAWGYDESGSSATPTSDVYRGPSAFSEPETQALRDFVQTHDIRVALNTHTYSDVLIYPWDYAPDLFTPDSAAFVGAARALTAVNRYPYGTTNQTLGYLVNGGSDDWMYGAEGVLAFTPEIGSATDGFWPWRDRLLPLAEETLDMYRQAMWLAGPVPRAAGLTTAVTMGTNDALDPGETGTLTVRLANDGRTVLDATVRVVSASPWLSVSDAGARLRIEPGAEAALPPVEVAVAPGAPLGDLDGLALEVTLGGTALPFPLPPLRVGTPVALFASDASSLAGWTRTGLWGVTSGRSVSPPSSFTDSPNGPYNSYANGTLTLAAPLDLTGAVAARLEFQAQWDLEPLADVVRVEASTDGSEWTALAGRHTVLSTGSGESWPAGTPGYEGRQPTWVAETLDLSAYDGAPALWLRFQIKTDWTEERDGFYVDDITVSRLVNGAGPVDGEAGAARLTTALGAPAPNPTTGAIRLGVMLATAGPADVAVYDVLGRRVATLLDGDFAAGHTDVAWDGRDAGGVSVSAGVYVVRLRAGGAVLTRQVIVLR